MAKLKARYVCQACGSVQSRWQGQCPDCAQWNTLVQESAEVSSIFAARHNLQGGGRMIPLIGLETPAILPERLPSGLAEFDLLGLQTQRDVRNFCRYMVEQNEAEALSDGRLRAFGRMIRAEAFPILLRSMLEGSQHSQQIC